MSGIQVSGLLSNSAFDWKSVVDQLIAVDSAPITRLNTQKSQNADKVTALANLQTALTDLQDSLQAIRANDPFSARSVSSDVSGTTWKSNSASGAAIGSYQIAVSQLATATKRQGAADIGSGLAATDDVTGLTIANLKTATAVTAGTFTVNGQAITVALTDSLQDVFDRINTATGGEVTATYDSATDRLKLVGATGEVVLGASNDTSNFLAVAKLVNNGTDTINSGGRLGTVKLSSPLASAGLKTAITAVDGSGNGTFSINGVSIAYNVNTDSLSALITRINKSTAGVTAAYDSTQDRLVLTNASTGDAGMAVTDVTGGALDALGLLGSSGTTTRGQNARFTVNGGDVLTSASNTLDATVHGITGLSVTVNSQSTQTVKVESDTSSMQTAIQNFIDKFNAVQDFIETNTKTTVSGNSVSTSVLTDNREVQSWASRLRGLAFDAVGGVTGSIQRLDNLGIDFDSTSGHLTIKNSDKLTTALAEKPDDVRAFFLTPTTGLVSKGYTYLTNLISSDTAQQSRINQASANIDDQIATLQSRLDAERQKLTNAFIAMLDAQSKAQSENTTITNAFLKSSSSG